MNSTFIHKLISLRKYLYKPALLAFVYSATATFCNGQKQPYLLDDPFAIKKKTFEESTIEDFKKTTTVFFYGAQSAPYIDSLKNALLPVWDITPLKFVNYDSASAYEGSAYTRIIIQGGKSVHDAEKGIREREAVRIENPHFYLSLDMSFEGGLARIELSPATSIRLSDVDTWKLYNKQVFSNWSPVLLRAQLSKVVTDLKNGIRTPLFLERSPGSLSTELSSDTLYISEANIKNYSRSKGKPDNKTSNIFSDYPFPYRICSESELYSIFVTGNRGRYLFEYVNSDDWKFITIYDLQEKDLIYRAVSKGHGLGSEDISKIK